MFTNGSIFIVALVEKGPFHLKIKVDPSAKTCCIGEVIEGGQGDEAGLKANDLIYSVPTGGIEAKDDFYKHLKAVTVEEISKWSESTTRPIFLAVKRYEGEPTIVSRENVDSVLVSESFPQVPFCKKCNSSKESSIAPHHHTFCPRHDEFEKSGAKDKMIIILKGLQVGCIACSFHLANGEKCPILKHNDKCISLTKRREKANCSTKSDDKKGHQNDQRLEAKRKKRHNNVKMNIEKDTQQARSKPVSSSPDLTTHSKEVSNLKDTGIILSRHHKKTQSNLDHRKKKEHKSLTNDRTDCNDVSSPKPRNSKRSKDSPTSCTDLIVSPELNGPVKRYSTMDVSNHFILTDDTSVDKWVSCPNPWGDHSHREGDFVLMSPFDYKVAYKSICNASKRFVVEPFAHNSSYYQSHVAPEDGLQVLQLTRDSLALRSWGFTFIYHDFGGACLISTVEPSSPAGSAVR